MASLAKLSGAYAYSYLGPKLSQPINDFCENKKKPANHLTEFLFPADALVIPHHSPQPQFRDQYDKFWDAKKKLQRTQQQHIQQEEKPKATTSEELKEEGNKYFKNQNFERAIDSYTKVMEKSLKKTKYVVGLLIGFLTVCSLLVAC